ncbi:MAG: PQQ-binding-like beta-propeller repeat protein [Vampirovibrionales bacterium]|nr:PQQ-binding-like beta-propeller repeat protein [Vampirovibrionales bacterium]
MTYPRWAFKFLIMGFMALGAIQAQGDAQAAAPTDSLTAAPVDSGARGSFWRRRAAVPAPDKKAAPVAKKADKKSSQPLAAGKIVWQTRLDGPVAAEPVADADSLFALSQAGVLYSLDPRDGRILWQKTLKASTEASQGEPTAPPDREAGAQAAPALSADHVFVALASGEAIALEKANGRERWRVQLGGPVTAAPLPCENGLLLVADQSGALSALNAQTGELRWRYDAQRLLNASPVAGKTAAYAVDFEGGVTALNLETGETLWKSEVEGPLTAAPILTPDVLLVSSGVGALFALDVKDGERRWSYTSGSPMLGSPIVVGRDVMVGDINGAVGCVALESGSRVWQRDLNAAIFSPLRLMGKSTLVTGDGAGRVVALNSHDGRRMGEAALRSVIAAPVAVHGARMFVGAQNATLSAVEWPK